MRELDAAIAHALGYRVYRADWEPHNSGLIFVDPPHYSTDGNAMLELDREMRERGWSCEVNTFTEDKPDANFYKTDGDITNEWYGSGTITEMHSAEADTEPLARSLAAYKALTGKEWTE